MLQDSCFLNGNIKLISCTFSPHIVNLNTIKALRKIRKASITLKDQTSQNTLTIQLKSIRHEQAKDKNQMNTMQGI